jgi:hypothetical protein
VESRSNARRTESEYGTLRCAAVALRMRTVSFTGQSGVGRVGEDIVGRRVVETERSEKRRQ